MEKLQIEAVTTESSDSAADRLYGILPWKGDSEELHRFLDDPDESQWGSHDA